MTSKLPVIDAAYVSKDQTVKLVFKLSDSSKVETVLIPTNQNFTFCLSSQVGCGMNCSFCFTGTQGLTRNLETQEIVGQFTQGLQWLSDNSIPYSSTDVVFMGQGEPLHNFDAVKRACDILPVPSDKITISTAGYLPGLLQLKSEMPDVNIALSLHSPLKEKRDKLIPINKRYPLDEVLAVIDSISAQTHRTVMYEYVMIKDFNDSDFDAHATGKLLEGKNASVNLIPFNSFDGADFERSAQETVERFKKILQGMYGLHTTIRYTRGDDIMAACGQLNTK